MSYRSQTSMLLNPNASSSDVHSALEEMGTGPICVNTYIVANNSYSWQVTFMHAVGPVALIKVDTTMLYSSSGAITSNVTIREPFDFSYSSDLTPAQAYSNISNYQGQLSSMIQFNYPILDHFSIGWWINERIFRVYPTNLTSFYGILSSAVDVLEVNYCYILFISI